MGYPKGVDNTQDLIDSRDVIARLAWCEEALDDGDEFGEEEMHELLTLRDLNEEGESIPDWHYGATLVRDDYFTDYAQEVAADMTGELGTWPRYCIDWDWAASELQSDYTPVEFDGVTYWVR